MGEEAVLTWGPPVKVNFELATPNSVHGCTLARPTWRCMKKGARVQCARAVCTCSARASVLNAPFSRGPEGHTGGATDPKLAGRTHTVPT